jgi:hypothetical protein
MGKAKKKAKRKPSDGHNEPLTSFYLFVSHTARVLFLLSFFISFAYLFISQPEIYWLMFLKRLLRSLLAHSLLFFFGAEDGTEKLHGHRAIH